MSEPKRSTGKILVHLLRPGVGAEDYQLSDGATLADLLGRAGVTTKNKAVILDGVLAERSAPLQDGSIVTIAPRPRNARALYETYKLDPARQAVPGFIDWRDFEPSWLPGGEQAPLATELITYRDRLDELLEHKGQFVVIKGKSVLGYYRDLSSALAAAFQEFGAVPVLVKQIVDMEPVRQLGRVVS